MTLLACLSPIGGGDDDKPKQDQPARITLKSDTRLRGTKILLRDIAVIQSADPRIVQRLRRISLGPRPHYTHNRIVTRQDVSQQLYTDGILPRHFKLDGAEQVVVQSLTTILKRQEVLAVATPALEAVLALEKADVEHSVRSQLRVLRVPPGRQSLNLRARLKHKPGPNSARIDVDVVVDGEVFKTVPIHYNLKRFHNVVVTSTVIKRNAVLGRHNIRLERRPKLLGATAHITDIRAVEGKVAARNLRSGENLTLGEFRAPAAIRKGEIVNLISISGRIKVSARVRALEDGAAGAFIRVQTLHYKGSKILTAKVHAPGVAVIQILNNRTRMP